MEYNIILTGVGGQGIITLAKMIGAVAMEKGLNTLIAETHGLSQRGGGVTVHLRIGDVLSPLVPMGSADLLIGLELIEAVRNMKYLSPNGVKAVNDYVIRPSVPKTQLPRREKLLNILSSDKGKTYIVPATELSMSLGSPIYTNTILLGFLVGLKLIPGLDVEGVKHVLRSFRRWEDNLRAFEMGYNYSTTYVAGV